MAYRLSGFPRLLQHPDVPAAAATQRFPLLPSSGGALAVTSQGINRGRTYRVVSTPIPQQCKLPRCIYVVWSWPRSPVQLRSVTPYKCHMYLCTLGSSTWWRVRSTVGVTGARGGS